MSEETIKKTLKESGMTGRISCLQVSSFAEKPNAPRKAFGKFCNSCRTEIRRCRPDCFK